MSFLQTRSSVLGGLRQLFYPRALRIAAPVWPAGLAAALERGERESQRESPAAPRAACEHAVAEPDASSGAPAHEQDRGLDERVCVEIATGLYRAGRAIGASEPRLPRAQRTIDAATAALARAGVEIIDLAGEPYDIGLVGIDPIVFEQTAGMKRETVVETVRPGVYINGRCVQESQVVVGVPVPGSPTTSHEDQETPT